MPAVPLAAVISSLGLGMDAPAGTVAAQKQMAQFTPTLLAFEAVIINILNLPLLLWALARSSRWERAAIRNAQKALTLRKEFLSTRGRGFEGDPLVDCYRARVRYLRQVACLPIRKAPV